MCWDTPVTDRFGLDYCCRWQRPLSGRQTLELFQRQCWGDFWGTVWSAYLWAFPSAWIPSWTERNCWLLNSIQRWDPTVCLWFSNISFELESHATRVQESARELRIALYKNERDSSVVRAPDSWLEGRGFESLQERRESFLLQGQLSVLTLYFGIRSTPVLPQ